MAYQDKKDAGARFELMKACLSGGINPQIIPSAMEFIDDGDISHLNGENGLKDLSSKSEKLKLQENLYLKDIETLTKKIKELQDKKDELTGVISNLVKEYADVVYAGYFDIKESFKATEMNPRGFRCGELVRAIPESPKLIYVSCNGMLCRINAVRKDDEGRYVIDCGEELCNLRVLTRPINAVLDKLSKVTLYADYGNFTEITPSMFFKKKNKEVEEIEIDD